MASLIPTDGAFYLTDDINNNSNSNRLYIGRETGIKSIVTPNPFALTIQGNGKTLTNGVYDGSSAKTINITPASIGALAPEALNNYYTKTEIDNYELITLEEIDEICQNTKVQTWNFTRADGSTFNQKVVTA